MLAILRRAAEEDAAAPLDPEAALTAALARSARLDDDGSDSDSASSTASALDLGGGCVLSGATVARLRAAAAASSSPLTAATIDAALTDGERAAFERAAAAGAVAVPAWRPWWSGGGALPRLGADGTRAVVEVGEGNDDDTPPPLDAVIASAATTAAPFPPPPTDPLPPVTSLTGGRPPAHAALATRAAAALYAYCWALRRANGDWGADPEAVAGDLVRVWGREDALTPRSALSAATARAAGDPSAPRGAGAARDAAIACLADVRDVASGRVAAVLALSDARRLTLAARTARKRGQQPAAVPAPPVDDAVPMGRVQRLRAERLAAGAAAEGRSVEPSAPAPPPRAEAAGPRSSDLADAAARLHFLAAWVNDPDAEAGLAAVADAAAAEGRAAAEVGGGEAAAPPLVKAPVIEEL